MAGYALGFDDGGEIDEPLYQEPLAQGEAADTMPEQSTGPSNASASADVGVQSSASPTAGLLANAEDTAPVQGIRKLASYLTGSGATPPQEAARAVAEIKRNDPGISDDDANLLAVMQANQMGGPAAAWGMVQYNRSAYNAKQAFAMAALNGVDGKAGDIMAAAQAASQAGTHVLDGSGVVFTAAPEGITATVTDPETRQRQQYRLTPEQFKEYLDVGKQGQWDKVMAQGIGGTLARISQAAGGSAAPPAQAQQVPAVADQSQQSNFGKTPSTLDLSGGAAKGDLRGYKPVDYSAIDDPKASLVERANQLFPSVSQQDQRAAWISAQEDKEAERENKLGVAEAGNKAKERIAAIQGGARTEAASTRANSEVQKQTIRTGGNKDVANIQANAGVEREKQKAVAAIAKMERITSDAKMREAGRMARAELTNPNMLLQKPEDVQRILSKYGISGVTGEAAPAPTGQPQRAPGAQASPPPGAKLYKGKWYTRGEDGTAVEWKG